MKYGDLIAFEPIDSIKQLRDAEDLEKARQDVETLVVSPRLAEQSHPAEPRFQVQDGRIRALYGHSFYVEDLSDLGIDPPSILYHGTSWDSLPRIIVEGLRPMSRQKVHLTNNPNEALEVARRHSRPALVAVRAEEVESLQAVADAVWAADRVDPDLLEIRNPVRESSLPPAWIFDSITRRAGDVNVNDPAGPG